MKESDTIRTVVLVGLVLETVKLYPCRLVSTTCPLSSCEAMRFMVRMWYNKILAARLLFLQQQQNTLSFMSTLRS